MLQIQSPFNGEVLNHNRGRQTADGLTIEVSGVAPAFDTVTVNGVVAERRGERFIAQLTLTQFENTITATASGIHGDATHSVRVLWDRNSRKRYRIGIDDNVFFLRELLKQKPANLFDNLYLSILKGVHDKYGTKYSLNCFYETPERDFNLSMLPDTWKQQFKDNSDWLRLTWHAYNEFPDRPYMYSSAPEIIGDLDKIHDEICRFAGEETWAMPTIIHWGEVPSTVLPALHDRGVNVLSGYFTRDAGRWVVSFGLDDEVCSQLQNRRLFMHWPSGIVFSRLAMVINLTPLEQITPILQKEMAGEETSEIIDLLTHEQYFWPFYKNYIAEHGARLELAARLCTENGYEPVFYHEGFLGI